MDFIKKGSNLYFIAAILFFIAAIRNNGGVWTVLGCANIVFGIYYKKQNK